MAPTGRHKIRGSRTGAWVLGLLLAGGLGVRVAHLGTSSFDIDEYLHVFSAQSLNTAGEPRLPSGNAYTRALPHTRLVALAFRGLGVSETSARLPSTLLDMAALLAIYLMTRTWFGQGAGLLALAAMAFSPWWVMDATNCRMYPLFYVTYLVAAWAAWQALEGSSGRRIWWAALAAGSLALSLMVHSLPAMLAISVGLFVMSQAVVTRQRRYLVLAALGLGAVALLAATRTADLAHLWRNANTAPAYATASRHDWGYYVPRWAATYPLFLLLYPAAMLRLLRRRPALGWFLLCAGLAPFLFHSVIFDWKRLRYTHYLLPWLVIPVSALLAEGLRWLWARRLAVRAPAIVLAAALAVSPWLWQTATQRDSAPPWRPVYAWLRPQLRADDAILTSMPLATLYYLGRPASYVINNVHLRDAGYDARRRDGVYYEFYSGQPMVTTLAELQAVRREHPRGWILIDARRVQKQTMTPEMLAYLREALTEVHPVPSNGGPNPVRVFRWEATNGAG